MPQCSYGASGSSAEVARHGILTEDAAVLCILVLGVGAQNGAETVVVDLVLVHHHKLTPPLLALNTLHLVLHDGLVRVEVGEVLDEVVVDVVVDFGQAEGAALDLFEDGPVRFEVLDGCDILR